MNIINNYYTDLCGLVVENIKNNTNFGQDDNTDPESPEIGIGRGYTFFDYFASLATLRQNVNTDKGSIRVIFHPEEPTLHTPGGDTFGDNSTLSAVLAITVVIVKNETTTNYGITEHADRQIQSDLGVLEKMFMARKTNMLNSVRDENGNVEWDVSPMRIASTNWVKDESQENRLGEFRVGQLSLQCTIFPRNF